VTEVSALVYVLFAVLFVGIQVALASVDEPPRGGAAADRELHDTYTRHKPDHSQTSN
jgi:hypothetical protein